MLCLQGPECCFHSIFPAVRIPSLNQNVLWTDLCRLKRPRRRKQPLYMDLSGQVL